MPDDDHEDDLDPGGESGVLKELRKQLKATEKDANEAKALRTENALLRAGLGDLSENQRKALLAAHDGGDMTAEAVRATWDDLHLPINVEPQVPLTEQAAYARIVEATSGAAPSEAYRQTVNDELNAAQSSEEVMAILRREGASS